MEPSNPSATQTSPPSPSPAPRRFRILEFYSGIGGMRYSLMKAGISGEVVEAFDINDTANDVYHHNFGHRPFQGNIQTLTVAKLDEYGAHAWLLSPPCQPYTRQGLQKHSADARAFSFVKILELIPKMLHPPLILFVENVVGFETSDTHEQMMKILAKIGFVTQEFILSPLQFGIPYSRPRYFCMAKRNPLSFCDPSFNNQLLQRPPVLSDNTISMDYDHHSDKRRDELSVSCEPIRNFLEPPILCSNQPEYLKSDLFLESNASSSNPVDDFGVGSISGCELENSDGAYSCNGDSGRAVEKSSLLDKYVVPHCLIQRWGRAMDIVYPDSKRCCFTKSYYRYVKGTGSLLATSEIIDSELAKESEGFDLNDLRLRYFMPQEVANLHSFPESFQFPPHLSLRQQCCTPMKLVVRLYPIVVTVVAGAVVAVSRPPCLRTEWAYKGNNDHYISG